MPFRSAFFLSFVLLFLMAAEAFAPPTPPDKEKKPSARDMAKAKLDCATRACQAVAQEFLEGKAKTEQVNMWSRRWMAAQREVTSKKADQVAAAEAHVNRLQQLEKAAKDKYDAKHGPLSDVYSAEYHRLDAEIELARVQSGK